jgi:hypothetical protein
MLASLLALADVVTYRLLLFHLSGLLEITERMRNHKRGHFGEGCLLKKHQQKAKADKNQPKQCCFGITPKTLNYHDLRSVLSFSQSLRHFHKRVSKRRNKDYKSKSLMNVAYEQKPCSLLKTKTL